MRRFSAAISIGIILFFTLAILPIPGENTASAAAVPVIVPFGGRILTVIYCVEGIWITVGPPRGGSFMFTAGSILYAWYQIYRPGPWVLGRAWPVTITCTICPVYCIVIGSGLMIDKVGTSLF